MISQGLEIAAQAKPLLPILWDEQFSKNLKELRAQLGVQAVQDGPWSWFQNPAIRKSLEL